ncbi:MAG: extracellular solute-binding protein family 1 [Clostridiales bacterium]|jgi:arabinogalactan oligomer/maltooligosaccharide transport system substrate-binding protein|nr:extracellular solute-binding protein family 1 [Clostridiales bacterium]
MKKVVILLLVLSMVLSMSGCKKEQVTAKFADDLKWDETKQEYVFEKKAELKFWADNDEYAAKIIELWDAKYPDVTLSYENVGSVDTAEKLKLDGPAGLGADVFYIPHNSIVDMRESGLLFQLPESDEAYIKEIMQDSATAVTMFEDNMYAVPSSVENIALVYNKQILAALPTLPSVLTVTGANLLEQIENEEIYLEELYEGVANWGNNFAGTGVEIPFLSDRFEDVDTTAEDIHTIFAYQLYDAYHNYPFLTRNGYRVFGEDNNDPTQFNITSKEVTESIKSVIGDWYGNVDGSKLFPGLATIQDIAWDQGPARLQKGQLAITISGPWVMGDIKTNLTTWAETGKFGVTADTKVSDLYGATKLPRFNNDVQPTTFSGVQVTGMNVYTDYPNATMNLMRFLASDEVMKEVYSTLGKIPSIKNSDNVPGLNEDEIARGFLSQAAFSHAMPVIQEGNYMWDPLRDVWTNIFDAKMSVEDAQTRSLDDYNKILQNSGAEQ